MAFQDQQLTCRECGAPFTWTVSEQEFYQQKGFENAPVRCPACRAKKKAERNGNGNGGGRGGGFRESFSVTCSQCGQEATVPFRPREGRPVLCRECFDKQKGK